MTRLGISKYGIDFLAMFMPMGAPRLLAPRLILIELVSYMARGISRGVRRAANMTAGHLLRGIISGFGVQIFNTGYFLLGVFPMIRIILLTALEIGVSIIQGYVFTLRTIRYINDGINRH